MLNFIDFAASGFTALGFWWRRFASVNCGT